MNSDLNPSIGEATFPKALRLFNACFLALFLSLLFFYDLTFARATASSLNAFFLATALLLAPVNLYFVYKDHKRLLRPLLVFCALLLASLALQALTARTPYPYVDNAKLWLTTLVSYLYFPTALLMIFARPGRRGLLLRILSPLFLFSFLSNAAGLWFWFAGIGGTLKLPEVTKAFGLYLYKANGNLIPLLYGLYYDTNTSAAFHLALLAMAAFFFVTRRGGSRLSVPLFSLYACVTLLSLVLANSRGEQLAFTLISLIVLPPLLYRGKIARAGRRGLALALSLLLTLAVSAFIFWGHGALRSLAVRLLPDSIGVYELRLEGADLKEIQLKNRVRLHSAGEEGHAEGTGRDSTAEATNEAAEELPGAGEAPPSPHPTASGEAPAGPASAGNGEIIDAELQTQKVDDQNNAPGNGRLGLWMETLKLIRLRPFWGVGVDGGPPLAEQNALKLDFMKPGRAVHNSYLEFTLLFGLPAFLCLALIFLRYARRLRGILLGAAGRRAQLLLLAAMLSIMISGALISSFLYSVTFSFSMLLVPFFYLLSEAGAEPKAGAESKASAKPEAGAELKASATPEAEAEPEAQAKEAGPQDGAAADSLPD